MAGTLAVIGEKWSLLVLREAFLGVRRFADFQRILGAPKAVLTERLGTLVASGILARVPYQAEGERQRHEYRLTDRGRDLYPTLVAQRHVDSYADLERKAAAAVADNELLREYVADLERRIDGLIAGEEQLRGDNARLREEVADLQRRLAAQAAADAEFKADVTALLAQAEQAVGGMIANFRRLTPDARSSPKEPRLRSV